MIRQRVRIRFRKEGDLRLISHRDLVRTFERMFRRAGLQLGMSEGFHPKARLSFPSALALGIAALDEVMEFELAEQIPAEQLRLRLSAQTPAGLTLRDPELLQPGQSKAQIRTVAYRLPFPEARQPDLQARLAWLREQPSYPIAREGRQAPIDLQTLLVQLEFRDGALHFRLHADRPVGVRPREVLEALGIADLEDQGHYLTRTDVELTPCSHVNSRPEENQAYEEGNADQCVAAGGMPDRDH